MELVTGSYLEIKCYFGNKANIALLDYADFRASFFKELKNWVKKKIALNFLFYYYDWKPIRMEIEYLKSSKYKTNPVDTRRRLNVYKSSIRCRRRWNDVVCLLGKRHNFCAHLEQLFRRNSQTSLENSSSRVFFLTTKRTPCEFAKFFRIYFS